MTQNQDHLQRSHYIYETFAPPPFCPISLSGSNFNPQNTNVFVWLKFSPSSNSNKNSYFLKASLL